LEKGFSELWRNSSVLHRFQNLKHGKCLKCNFYLTHCYGGCISGSLSSTGSPDDELCFVDLI
jgi:radical SAM protein with 4Fe4S-binding SPASM domain